MLLNKPRAHKIIREAGLDVLIATHPDNVAYMSDYLCMSHRITPGVQVYGILPGDDSRPLGLVIPSLEVDAWAEQPGEIEQVSVYGTLYRNRESSRELAADDQRIYDHTIANETPQDALAALVATLDERGLADAAIGVDESNLEAEAWKAMIAALPRARVVPAASLFRQIRMIKTEEEIRRMARSAEITERAIQHLFSCAREGITERELANQFNARVAELGGLPGFWIVSAGRRTAHTHARQSDYAVRQGDFIKVDMGCTCNFYWSDVGRTKALGEPGDRERRIYEILCAGLRAAIDRARPGAYASELYDTAIQTIRELGLPDYRRHHCGHGIGISVYDPPLIQPRDYQDIYGVGSEDVMLEAGMAINLETPYYLLGECGFIVEETVVVRDDGPHVLTWMDHSPTISS
ncbi:MAG: Xaa-Pro peptidase family protein [Ardenticatenaceae bacterium]|nr:Xaa-Pro peptidase family protein [Ardenticatenaceae bacterium]HBY94373.1 hypothetical protein [Chloroflexota bacterium]